MNVVTREDFEAVREMAQKARQENEALAARIAALEAEVAKLKPGAERIEARRRRSAASTT